MNKHIYIWRISFDFRCFRAAAQILDFEALDPSGSRARDHLCPAHGLNSWGFPWGFYGGSSWLILVVLSREWMGMGEWDCRKYLSGIIPSFSY